MPASPATSLDAAALLARIGLRSPGAPSHTVLAAIQSAFVQSVPFENLDIHAGRPIALDTPRLFDKVVTRRRGGFCYELNALLHWLLSQLGFSAALVAGRTFVRGQFGHEFDHMALLVRFDETWLVDAGFAGFSRLPLRLDNPEIQSDGYDRFRLKRRAGAFEAYGESHGDWRPRYRFTTTPRRLEDFAPRCNWHQTAVDSLFRKQMLCSLALPRGQKTLLGERYIHEHDGKETARHVTPAERDQLLRREFGIDVL